MLSEAGIAARPYHGQLSDAQRNEAQALWQSGQIKVVVATISFGMGVSKLDVRFVIHHTIPNSIEAYYQQSGRAGRDAKPARCVCFFAVGDIFKQAALNCNKPQAMASLHAVAKFCEERITCRKQLLRQLLDGATENQVSRCDSCDNCCSKLAYRRKDISGHIKSIIMIVRAFPRQLTVPKLVAIWKGSKNKETQELLARIDPAQLDSLVCSKKPAPKLERIAVHALIHGILEEKFKNTAFSVCAVLALAAEGRRFENRPFPITYCAPVKPTGQATPTRKRTQSRSEATRVDHRRRTMTLPNLGDSDDDEIIFEPSTCN